MTRFFRPCAVIVALALLCGCQPTLDPVVPAGDAAYSAISATTVPADAEAYLLQAGDQLSITVFREPDLSAEKVAVDNSGNVQLPLIGSIVVAGRSATNLGQDIERAYASRFVRDPHVTVSVVEAAPRIVSVEGEVTQPGAFEMKPGSTLLSALAMARSPKRTAKLDEIIVFRTLNGQRLGGRFDLQAIRSGSAPDPLVLDGDVVVVGFSQVQGIYEDILRAAPLLNSFIVLSDNNN